jgi:riboflavin synthase
VFTGIIEELGHIETVERTETGARLRIAAEQVLSDVRVGDSIAVNGVCLTATGFDSRGFTVDVIPETLQRSNLGEMAVGDPVNLERPMAADGRFDGHIVQGHVDATGVVSHAGRDGAGGFRIRVEAPTDVLSYIVEKGSITIDGVSLTVAGVDSVSFEVALIPHTLEVTRLGVVQPGDTVNLEVDVIAKYVARHVASVMEARRP